MGKKASKGGKKVPHLGIATAKVDKKPHLYVNVPDSMARMEPLAKDVGLWYGHATSPAQHYPFAVMDADGTVLSVRNKVQMEVSYKDANGGGSPEPSVYETGADKGNIYWFRAINPYLYGELTLKFSVLYNENQDDKKYKDFVRVYDVAVDEYGNAPVELTNVKKGKARKVEEVGGSSSESPSKKSKKKKKADADAFASTTDIVLPFPRHMPIGPKHRLCRGPNGDKDITIGGSILSLSLSSSLVAASLDDQTRVKCDALRYEESKTLRDPSDESEIYFNRPTVNELFLKVSNRMSHVQEAEGIVETLRYLFEFSFEESILYSEEKELLKEKLDNINNEMGKFADHFGPYYFLRFLIFYATCADSYQEEDDDEKEANSSSSQRRSAVSDRVNKSTFAKSQEVIDLALRDLDECAGAYFC